MAAVGVTLHPVESSMMSHVGYDAEKKVLSILFGSGKLYEYEGVPKKVLGGLRATPSKGSYFNDVIADVYPYRLVRGRRR